MGPEEFANLQEALMWVLGPSFLWLLALMLAAAIFAAVMVVFMALTRRLTRRRI